LETNTKAAKFALGPLSLMRTARPERESSG